MLPTTDTSKWLAPLCLIFLLSLSTTVLGHPIKLTASLVEYDPKAKTLRMECNVFIDDFEWSLTFATRRDKSLPKITKANRPQVIEEYFKNSYVIEVNGMRLPLKYDSSETFISQNVLLLKFKDIPIHLKSGDKVSITNTLFFQDYKYLQTNHIVVRMPPFVVNERHAAKVDKYSFSYQL